MQARKALFTVLLSLIPTLTFSVAALGTEELNIYSARHYDADLSLYNTFTEQTGIKVNLIEGDSDALIERIVNEGEFTPADILITVDAGRLWRAQQKDIFQPIDSDILNKRVPKHLREPNNLWFGLSTRARVIVYNKKNPPSFKIKTYEDLTDPRLKSTVCMRSSSNIYNLSLMASMIEAHDIETANDWAKKVVGNFARTPQSNDTGNLKAVASGECGVTIANTYYLGRWLATEETSFTESLGVVFPNQKDRGTHINISGAGVTKFAPHKANAVRFLEYLTSDFAQRLFAEGNNEYPIIGKATGPIAKLGEFKPDAISASVLGENQSEAVKVYDRAGWQ